MRGVAATWVRSNCTNPKLVKDLLRFLFDSNAAGVNCWFLIGGGLIRTGPPCDAGGHPPQPLIGKRGTGAAKANADNEFIGD